MTRTTPWFKAMLLALLLIPAIAHAQTTKPPAKATPAQPKKPREFVIGGLFAAPSAPSSTTEGQLQNSSGSASSNLFRTRNRVAMGYGVEAHFAYEWKRALWLEVSGGWTRSSLSSKVVEDFEGAQGDSVDSPMNRFIAGGAIRWEFRAKPKSVLFFRVDGGWMKETAGGNTLTGDGFIGGGGIGLRRWWSVNRKTGAKRIGLRIEGRATISQGGLSFGDTSFRIWPVGAAHLVFGY